MKRMFLLLILLAAPLSAKIEVAESRILETDLAKKIAKHDKIVVQAYSADDDTHSRFDGAFKNNKKMLLYKLPYKMMNGKEDWKRRRFGNHYEELETVFVVYHKGQKVTSVAPKKGTTVASFKKQIQQAVKTKQGLK